MAHKEQIEIEMIERAQAGDQRAFDELALSYHPRMVRTALRIVRNGEDAEDVAQQAWLAAWRNIGQFRGDSAFTTWLTRIVINEAFVVMRRRQRQIVELKEQTTDSHAEVTPVFARNEETPEAQMIKSERRDLLRRSLDAVKPVYRSAMRLRLEEDLSLEEIAGRLKMPVNTVKVHLYRGRLAMKGFLEDRMVLGAAAA